MTATAGVILLNSLMPKDIQFEPDKPIDKKTYTNKLKKFAEKYPELYKERIHKITALAEKMAYYLGANVGTKDLRINEKEVEKHIKKIEREFKKAKTDTQKKKILMKAFNEAQKNVSNMNDDNNEMLTQIKSSARGKPAQLARMSWAPFYAVGMDQTPKPIMIKNNFIKGLNTQEYFAVASQGRFSAVQTANATSEPGEFGKVLVANTDNQVITKHDCGTKNGICMSPMDHHIVGRYEAGTNRLIDEKYWKELKNKKVKCVRVRSPITCEASRGICAMCYGLKSNGRLPAIGEEVGIEAAQSIGEPLTQMVLSTKHSVGAKDEEADKLQGMEGFKIVVNSPSNFKQKAAVAPVSGRVIRIDNAPQGGHFVYINSDKTKVYVQEDKKLKVKQGDFVYKGQELSTGIVSVKDKLEHQGIGAARKQEADLLHQTFLNSTGKDLNKKHFEVIARGHLSLAKDDEGELYDINAALKNYPSYKKKVIVGPDIVGKYLAENVDVFLKGTLIDDYILNMLKLHGVRFVYITDQKPPVKPVYKTLVMRPNFNRNLFAKLNYRYLQKAITDEVKRGKGFKTDEIVSGREKHTAHRL